MLIAAVSDIHGNLPALEAAVADAGKRGAAKIICCGDMTGYGPFPREVCQFLRDNRIPSITGNYDVKVLETARRKKSAAARGKKGKILLWTVREVDRPIRLYLKGLPDRLDLRLSGGSLLSSVHGSPLSADDTIYPSITREGLQSKLRGPRPTILLCGHTHIPFVKSIGGILVVNCGSAGHPVDGDPRPAYALVDTGGNGSPRGRIIRFDYDRERTIRALQESTLPKMLRRDFIEGNKRRF